MKTRQQPPRYHAYMLRVWEERSDDHAQSALWRFQVEDPHTGRRHGFNDISALFRYLQDVITNDEDRSLGAATFGSTQEVSNGR
jgi:hypothetical protein